MNPSIPNLLSWSRIVLAVPVAALHLVGGWCSAAALFLYIVAALTDYADGRIARSSGRVNPFGTFLDPVADKVLVVFVLLALVATPEPPVDRVLLAALAAVVIVREIAQSALRDWMSQLGRHADVGVTAMSKSKTALQMVALGMLIGHGAADVLLPGAPEWFAALVAWGGAAMLAVAAALGLLSLLGFMRTAFSAGDKGG